MPETRAKLNMIVEFTQPHRKVFEKGVFAAEYPTPVKLKIKDFMRSFAKM